MVSALFADFIPLDRKYTSTNIQTQVLELQLHEQIQKTGSISYMYPTHDTKFAKKYDIALLGSFYYKSTANVDNARHTKDAVAKVQELRDDNTRIVMYPKYRMFGYAYYFNKERFKNYDKEYGYYNVIEGFHEENLYAINQYSEARIDSFCYDKLIFMMTDAGPKEQFLADFEKEFELLNTYHYPEIIDIYEFRKKESVLID